MGHGLKVENVLTKGKPSSEDEGVEVCQLRLES